MTMTLLHPHRTTAVLFIPLTMIHNINVSINCLNRLKKKKKFFLDLKIKIIFVVLNQKLSRWNPRWDEPWAVLPVSKRGTTSQMYRCKDVSCYKHKHTCAAGIEGLTQHDGARATLTQQQVLIFPLKLLCERDVEVFFVLFFDILEIKLIFTWLWEWVLVFVVH